MRFTAIASLGFAAVVSAQSTTTSSAAATTSAALTGCVKANNDCIYAPDANQAQCAANNVACQTACQSADNQCIAGPDPNFSFCASQYAGCLGENPYDNNGTLTLSILGQTVVPTATFTTTRATSVQTAGPDTAGCKASYNTCRTLPDANMAQCAADNAACQGNCQDNDNNCRVAPDANFSFCASNFASCLGENPYDNNGTLTLRILGQSAPVTATLASSTGSVVYTTEVVTALTTYCPAATSLTFNNQVYTISSATTLTITNCPCTITKASSMPVASGPATMAKGNMTASATITKPATYTGAAVELTVAGSGLVAAVFGAIFFL